MNTDKCFKLEPNPKTRFRPGGITQAIIDAAFDGYNELGYGYLHPVYQNSLVVELNRRGRRRLVF